jgi:DNA-binding transcriptional LysR family regulator
MNHLSCQYFVAAAHAGSLRQAADELMITPQSLSEHIHKIERELGVELFTKTRPAKLTTCGEHFLKYAESILLQRYTLEKELRDISDKHREIVLSLAQSDTPPFVYGVITQFLQEYPECLIKLVQRPDHVVVSELRTYDLNLSSERLAKGMNEILLMTEQGTSEQSTQSPNELAVLVHTQLLRSVWKDRFAENMCALQAHMSLELFQEIPFIRLSNESFNKATDQFLASCGFLPHTSVISASSDYALGLCIAGAGALFVPDGWAMTKAGGHIHEDELQLFRVHAKIPMLNMMVSYPADKDLRDEERALIQMMQEYVLHL